MRASALSDEKVISTVNEFCIPVELNVTTDGFPVTQLPILKVVESIYQSNWRNEFGFANCMLLDPEGKIILGCSALSKDINERLKPDQMFSSQRYIKFLVVCLERYEKIKGIRKLPPLQQIKPWAELLKDIGMEIAKSVQSMLQFQASLQ